MGPPVRGRRHTPGRMTTFGPWIARGLGRTMGPMNRDSYELNGPDFAGTATFAPEMRGDPLEAFPSLCVRGRPFNLSLTTELLEPLLERWTTRKRSRSELAETVAADVDDAMGRACLAFGEVASSAPAPCDQALLAATGVAANLQRTLALLGEFMLGDAPDNRGEFALSRLWCGLVDYPRGTGYFSMSVEAAAAPAALRPNRRDYGHLRNALRCPIREIETRCGEGLRDLGEHLRRTGMFGPGDLRHLLTASIPWRQGAQLTRTDPVLSGRGIPPCRKS